MILTSLDDLERMVADGKITEHDRDEVRDFAQLLGALGPPLNKRPRPRTYTVVEAIAMEKYSHDRDPEFAAMLRKRITETWIRECR